MLSGSWVVESALVFKLENMEKEMVRNILKTTLEKL
jgi:hypothetical protein